MNASRTLRKLPEFLASALISSLLFCTASAFADAGSGTPAGAPAAIAAPPVANAVPPAPAQAPTQTPAQIKAEALARAQAREQAQYDVMLGEMAAGRNQPELAAQAFLKSLDYYQDADLASRATMLALSASDADLAQTAATRWLQLDPSAQDAREVLLRLALRKGSLADTYAQAAAIVNSSADGAGAGLAYVSRILTQANGAERDIALAVMDKLAAQWPQLPEAHHALGTVALHFDKPVLAESAAREAMRLAPKNKDHALLLVGALVKQGRIDDADHEMEPLIKSDPHPDALRLGYAQLLLQSNQRDHAQQQLQTLLKQNPADADASFALGVLALNDHDYDSAASYLKPLLDGRRGLDAAYQMGRMAEERKDYQSALDYYERVVSGNSAIDASVRRAYVLAALGRYDEAQDTMQDLRGQLPQLAQRFWLTEGDLLFNAGQADRALKVYDDALTQYPNDADLLYGRSLVCERSGKIDLAEADLRTMIAANADDARALNALGYMLTVHTKRYAEAEKLIAKALQLDSGDAAILDSMGWVQFRLGNSDQASKLLQQAYDKFPDPEVAAHLGEVLWTLGEKAQAQAIWNKALKDSPDQPVLKETVDRLSK